MNMEQSIFLRSDELHAIMAMGGAKVFFCFAEQSSAPVARERLLSATCDLQADGLLTQIDGQYRLRKDLFDVVYPIYQAKSALVLTAANTQKAQMIFYFGEQISALRKAHSDGYYLQPLTREELGSWITEYLEPEIYEPLTTAPEFDMALSGSKDSPVTELLEHAEFVLELIDISTQRRTRWLRGLRSDFIMWSEYCADATVVMPMTAEQLEEDLKKLTEGA